MVHPLLRPVADKKPPAVPRPPAAGVYELGWFLRREMLILCGWRATAPTTTATGATPAGAGLRRTIVVRRAAAVGSGVRVVTRATSAEATGRAEFVGIEHTVPVLVKGAQHIGRSGNLGGVNHAVVIGVEKREQRVGWRRSASPATRAARGAVAIAAGRLCERKQRRAEGQRAEEDKVFGFHGGDEVRHTIGVACNGRMCASA